MQYKDCGDYVLMVYTTRKGEVYTGKIDKTDIAMVRKYTWCVNKGGYFQTTIKGKYHALHSLIYGEKECLNNVLDHINRERRDNRRVNLREVNCSVNSTNASIRSDKTQTGLPRGVTFREENKERRADGKGQKRFQSFEVQWSINGKRFSKTFSVKKIGNIEKAKKMAINFREERLREMKI